jgi:hypothetical protein
VALPGAGSHPYRASRQDGIAPEANRMEGRIMHQQRKHSLTLSLPGRDQRNILASAALSAAILFLPGVVLDSLNGEALFATTATDTQATLSPDARWGIEVIGLRSTAANYMLEFRYRVVNADKAAPLFVRKTKPYLIHQASGKVLGVPTTAKLGPLRNSNTPQQGRTYWMFFGNAARLVSPGDTVRVTIGDYDSGELTVE